MNKQEKMLLRQLTEQIQGLIRGDFSSFHPAASACPEIDALSGSLSELTTLLAEARDFVISLSQGTLEREPPSQNHLISGLKQLQANLRHLTWQTKQIAAGDLSQHVDFLGEFSIAFNTMIAALSEKRQAEEKLRYVSNHDPLTDLYNRGYFADELERIERGRRFPVSIMVADLDGLKKVNDTLGHAAGDQLIRQAAKVFRLSVRGDDVVARMGGDEFALILPNTDIAASARVLERIRDFEAELNRETDDFQISISIGIATAEQGESLEETLKLADKRMYEEKFFRKNGRKTAATTSD
jgi:two-component system, cell cycle response regulator